MDQTGHVATYELIIEQQVDGAPDLVNIHKDVRLALRGIREYSVADAALVVVMLAGDACRYGKPPVALRILRSPSCLRIEIDDHRGPASAPASEDYRARLLERMTRARGVDREDGLTTTWAEIELSAEPIAS